jgi:imidazolonepropionase
MSAAGDVLRVDNIGQLLTADGPDGEPLGTLRDATVVCRDGSIVWVGPAAGVEGCGVDLARARRIDAAGALVTPGLIDCHAHPIFAGDRADEFARRAAGQSYLEIAAAGGGINATLGPTRAASFEDLVASTSARMTRALHAGTTTCEAKSGYDLTTAGELRLLEVAREVDRNHPIDIVPTLLGAHLVPPERRDDRAGYVSDVVDSMIPAAAEGDLADAVDVYCDEGAFNLEETRTILTAARHAGLQVRAHVGQFADLGGAELLAELGGLSADHLEQVSEAGIAAMAAAEVVAVMLPGACVQLRMTPPPVEALRAAGVAMAVASDMNPGTSHCETLPIQMWLATTHYGMTVEETWLGVTRVAARALGRDDIGVIRPGAAADLVIWDADSPAEIPYRYGGNLARTVIKGGRPFALA